MIQALGASQGIAIGKAFVLPHWEWELPDQKIDVGDLAKEFDRLYEGIRRSKTEISQMKTELDEAVGSEEASIFDAHLAILEDPVFMNEIQGIIQRQYKVAEVAVKEAIDHFVTMFDLLDDEYMKERALDIKDVGNRLLKHLLGAPEISLPEDTQPFVLVVRELSPSQLVHLKPELVLGIVTMVGSPTSHSAIMARAFGIPMVMGAEGKLEQPIGTGDLLILDGETGMLQVDPTPEMVARYTEMRRRLIAQKEQLLKLAEVPSVTMDGLSLTLAANISSLKELEAALGNGAQGVGLFRTEFLYMDRSHFPSEEEQFEVYRTAVQKLKGETLVVRTLDIGGDKQLDYYEMPEEENPFLGFRAIRFSLKRKDLFKIQLRAILRASNYGDVQIMYPLITSVEEVREANEVLAEAKRELEAEGVPFRSDIKAGIMVEVPAAVAIADILAEEASFFSIGTNDLIQFTLAVDRMNEQISHMYEPFHPAILRMIRSVAQAAKAKGIPVNICGEIAGDVNALPIWLALGIDELSLSAQAILPVKERLLRSKASDSRRLLDGLFRCRTSKEARELARQFHAEAALAPGSANPLV
ncbi:phosphoenolpyruvate--protein phosphotransferase [Cohnella sp. CIP 111063]|uniref:phosphoenolpyruvate--protein phosphotransferase n=1 Tax=unclassified Cohnella TaxID=2636738 RepID=UPI000B8C6944|nr:MULTISPECIES: phosphoenolpyruvate--protein phosphotransferase [unclassified Cohnella]OXS62366.1 phosphoenolpyruvate--protein phosphotransferase [Cohnella sp. CIP 111063]PRX74597.1 phosphotransferase system enzyme I (PtsI) [Cohnella sp. SGD-V74]